MAGLAAAAGAWGYAGLLDLPAALRDEVRWALLVLALAAPLVLVNAALWGVLAAHQRFAGANLVNLPILALYYLGPLAVLQIWDSLIAATLVLVACRAAMTWAYWRLGVAALPELLRARPDWPAALVLLRQGGWLTVSHLLGPLAQHLDRFIIAARISAEAAALYATPFDLVIRIAVLGQAVLAGVFPALASALAMGAGRAERNAGLAVAELALYLPVLLVALDGWGIGGAAMVWSGRALLVAVVRARLAVVVHPPLAAEVRALGAALVLAEAAPLLRVAAVPALVLPAIWFGWRHGLGAAERQALVARVVLALRLR